MQGWFKGATGELFTNFPIHKGDVVADIGCGEGGYAGFCASQGAFVILADVDADSLARATKKVLAEPNNVGCKAYLTNSDPLPVEDESVDCIVCTEVLEHVESPERLIAELVRIGRPNAKYLLACPDPQSEAIQQRVAHPAYFEKPNHIRIIQHAEFERYVEAAGLIIESRHRYGFYWTIWWTLFWASGVTADNPGSELLDSWTETWDRLLDTRQGSELRQVLDDALPKSQMIIARKPALV
jgi:2-polyprenyl-3-methyl-5-hydroxy-6-metoxy-1,4-benzoquinol methylase